MSWIPGYASRKNDDEAMRRCYRPAQKVIRCKDCVHADKRYNTIFCEVNECDDWMPEDFCSYGANSEGVCNRDEID